MTLPSSFIDSLPAHWTESELNLFLESLSQESPVSVRLNPSKCHQTLSEEGKVPWASNAFYLAERPTFTFDPLFHAGCYYVQEASSMFVEQALRCYMPQKPVRALDLCAAPGGKSTLVRSLLPQGSLLVANEVMRNRVQILAENLTKWGHPDVVVTNNGSADFTSLNAFFDIILTDVPCSGEGMFRKDEMAIEEWSPENVALCWKRQQDIIRDIWPALKPGGLLVYSTCTYNTNEDEENVKWIAEEYGAEILPIPTQPEWNITGNLMRGEEFPVYRFIPHRTRGEGFFLAMLRKPMNAEEDNRDFPERKTKRNKDNKRKKDTTAPHAKELLNKAKGWLKKTDDFNWQIDGNQIHALSASHAIDIEILNEKLRVVMAGVKVGEMKGKDLIPEHALAMSNALNLESFETFEVDYNQAIAYLRKEAISLSETASLGYILLTYQGKPLGFVKNLGRRANNLYPQEWRIRSGYLPDKIKLVFES